MNTSLASVAAGGTANFTHTTAAVAVYVEASAITWNAAILTAYEL